MKLKLKEIVWEMTNKCQNKCYYCGSQESASTEYSEPDYRRIIDRIADYPPEIIDISGGDPLLVDYEIHRYLCEKLNTVKRHILVNPLSLRYNEKRLETVKLYEHVGVSVNTEDEIKAFTALSDRIPVPMTVITNFNLLNFYLVEDIASAIKACYVDRHGTYHAIPKWQVQFTMSHDQNMRIYDKPKAVELLNTLLGKCNCSLIAADNANAGSCGAGITSLGILHNGLVVPCLSMRSWCDDLTSEVQGNLYKEDLKTIWRQRFERRRFETCECCKDFCGHAQISPKSSRPEYAVVTTPGTEWIVQRGEFPRVDHLLPQVTVYAVFSSDTDFTSSRNPMSVTVDEILGVDKILGDTKK